MTTAVGSASAATLEAIVGHIIWDCSGTLFHDIDAVVGATMIFLLGSKSTTRVLGGLTAWCTRCEAPRAHQLYRRLYRLTLFFMPTVPVRYGHFTVCLSCANTLKVTAAEADRLSAYLDR